MLCKRTIIDIEELDSPVAECLHEDPSLETSDLDEAVNPVDIELLKNRREVSAQCPWTLQSSQSRLKPPLMLEYEIYQTMALPERDVDALEWWKQNENELPLLAGVARGYLAVPVTSASLERMFSLGGRLVQILNIILTQKTLAGKFL